MRPERDEHREPGRPPVQRSVHRPDEQGQRERPGTVGHQHADAPPVERVPVELLKQYRDYVKSGLTGDAFIRLGSAGEWPAWLQPRLPDARS